MLRTRAGEAGKLKGAARALYRVAPSPPTAEEAAFWGLTIEEATPVAPPDFPVWPDNWVAVCTFIAIESQWRVGFNGPYGLDYNVLYRKLDRMNLEPDEYEDVEASVRELEAHALTEMREHAKRMEAKSKKGKA